MNKVRILAAAVLILVIGGIVAGGVSADGSQQYTSDVLTFDPFPIPGSQVEGATARLTTNQSGATVQVQTNSLTPGTAVTLWWVIFNNPQACAGYASGVPCNVNDLFGNTAAVGGEVTYAAGRVIGGDGQATFAGHLPAGDVPQGWFGNGLPNPTGAEIHVVVHTHGPVIPELVADMISSFRGGCADDAVIAPGFPAYEDGIPGPNQCMDLQFAVFQQ